MSASIKEVALKAGVSIATVSRVLNSTGPVATETRRRILEAIEGLRYVPHGAARSLITNQTDTIGVLLPDLYGEFFSEVIRGIDAAARGRGFHVLISGFHSDRAEIEAVLRAMRGRVDGLIVLSPDVDAQSLSRNLPDTLPVVLLNTHVDGRLAGAPFDAINLDNHGGAFAMVRHLAGLGHQRIALIRGPEENADARERLRGYRDALRALGMVPSDGLELSGDFSEESGTAAGRRLLTLKPRPTAVFAANDSMAIGCLFALREAGVGVPEEVALAGFDDIPIARYITPSLSSVHVPIAELGTRAMERLLHAVESKNGHERRQETVATTLVVRDSCGGAVSLHLEIEGIAKLS
ncbi:MAG TPA: LacI family DNA-binding transcriptional regulator [Thermoanaerobaculia bacterium]|jgi:LacI family transcriptional regulator|nr:LacI family DNA-binding transcriptional regulator [Thermoanaerobaculia bacterium]